VTQTRSNGESGAEGVWRGLLLLIAFFWWLIVVIWAIWVTVADVWFVGLAGLAAAGGGVVALRTVARQPWASAFFWAACMGFVLMLVTYLTLLAVLPR
jgi:hypothetical protein